MKNYAALDNAATSFPKPAAVAKAMRMTMERNPGNPGRGGSRMAINAARTVFEARTGVAELLGLPNAERLVFTKNATEGINFALFGLIRPGMRVGRSKVEHNAVVRPLARLGATQDVTLVTVGGADGLPDPSDIPDDLDLLVTTAASNVTGAVADVAGLAAVCRAKGITLVVDAAQAAGAVPLDFSGAHAVAASGHKGLLGPQGTGFVWFASDVDPTPTQFGGTGSESESKEMPGYWPDRFEAGTVNTPGLAGLAAGVAWIKRQGIDAIREQELAHAQTLIEALGNEERVKLSLPTSGRTAVISFTIDGVDPGQAAVDFDRRGVAVRSGLHCAPDAHRFVGTFPAGTVRVSPGPLTRKRDIERFCRALKKVAR